MKKHNIIYLLAAVMLLSSCGSESYKVSRETEINAPVSEVYAQVVDHRNRENWDPWEAKDSAMTKEFTGPESGVGAIQKWSGNEEVGTGSLEILEARENEYIKNKLAFTEPWESESTVEWMFESTDGKTKVTWQVSGEMPKMAAMFMDQTMDEMMGPDFEKGLADLKSHVEANYTPEPVETEMPADSTMSATTAMVEDEATDAGM